MFRICLHRSISSSSRLLHWVGTPLLRCELMVVESHSDKFAQHLFDNSCCLPSAHRGFAVVLSGSAVRLFASPVLDRVAVDTLKPAPGSRHRHKRKGRGIAAGQGASCGFGMRGQKSRSGPGVRAGFEGGQTPLYRRLPKLVGRPMGPGHTKKVGDAYDAAQWDGRRT